MNILLEKMKENGFAFGRWGEIVNIRRGGFVGESSAWVRPDESGEEKFFEGREFKGKRLSRVLAAPAS